jgi:hypothetical protein
MCRVAVHTLASITDERYVTCHSIEYILFFHFGDTHGQLHTLTMPKSGSAWVHHFFHD